MCLVDNTSRVGRASYTIGSRWAWQPMGVAGVVVADDAVLALYYG